MESIDWTYVAELLSIFLTAGTKFLFSPSLGYYFGLTLTQTFLLTTAGGITGIFAFAFLGEVIRRYWRKFTCLFIVPFSKKSYLELVNEPSKRFSRTKRLIVKIKKKFGLFGIAFVTPAIISIPVGTVIAMNLYTKKRKVLLALCISLLSWSVVLNLITPLIIEFFADLASTK